MLCTQLFCDLNS